MKNERVKTLPATELVHLLFTEFFLSTHAGKTEKSTSQQQFPIFSAELSRMKRSVELLSRETMSIDFNTVSSFIAVYKFEWFSQQPTLTFLHPYFRASGRSREKSQISRFFGGQICGKNGRFRGNFAGQFRWKTIGKVGPISWELSEQISLESDWFCADLTKGFNETRRSYRFTQASYRNMKAY